MRKKMIVLCSILLLVSSVTLGYGWEGQIETGLLVSRGNVESTQVHSKVSGVRQDVNDLIKLGAEYLYGEQDRERENEKFRLYEEAELGFNDKYYWVADSSFENDYGTALDRRVTLSPGIGVYLIKKENLRLNVDAGMSYILEKYDDHELTDDFLYRGRQKLTYNLTKDVFIEESAVLYMEAEEHEHWRFVGEASVWTNIADNFGLKLTFRDEYNNNPLPGNKHNDCMLVAGVTYDF